MMTRSTESSNTPEFSNPACSPKCHRTTASLYQAIIYILHGLQDINATNVEFLEVQHAFLEVDLCNVVPIGPSTYITSAQLDLMKFLERRQEAFADFFEQRVGVSVCASDKDDDANGVLGYNCEDRMIAW